MPVIQIMSESLSNRIAAGEVVQRPSSVVKELIENSLDAGATEIVIQSEDGGRELIRVSDNGTGMDRDDLLLAFEQHATSKLFDIEDLTAIKTLGFRGEALASIASVSRVDARTCNNEKMSEGFRLILNGGTVDRLEGVAMKQGTSITIRNLFFNTPARKKFLKSANSEYRHIVEVVRRFALARPGIRFHLTADDRDVYVLPPEDLSSRLRRIFSKRIMENCIEVHEKEPPLSLKGYMGTRELVRRKSGEQYLYVNGRLVTDRMMNSAVYSAYGSHLDKGEFPFFVLFLTLLPEDVDVNVHPAKTEVKFRSEWQIYQFIRRSCEQAIRDWSGDDIEAQRPSPMDFKNFSAGGRPMPQSAPPRLEGEQLTFRNEGEKDSPDISTGASLSEEKLSLDERLRRFEKSLTGEMPDEPHPLMTERNFWQAHGRYMFTQISSGVVIIDQRAAHTRILYDRAIKSLQKASASASQQLLFPVSLELSPDDFSILLEIVPSLEKLGFSMREFGKYTILIEAVPADLQWLEEGKVVLQILDDYKASQRLHNPVSEKIALAYAERAAIRRGEEMTPAEMQRMTDELFQTDNPYLSPTGKPVIIRLTLNELDRRFERN